MESRRALNRDVGRLDRMAEANSVMFHKAKGQVLPLGHNNSLQFYRLGKEMLERCLAERDLGC